MAGQCKSNFIVESSTRACKIEFIARSIVYVLTLIAFIVYYLKWNELADFVNSLHVADSNSTESLQDSSLNSSEPIALGRGGRISPSCESRCDGEDKEKCLERCEAVTVVSLGLIFLSIVGIGLAVYPFRFLARRVIKGIIDEINRKSKS